MITVIMNPVPNARAMILKRVFSITTFPECSVDEISSEVIKSMIAITASHRLMSDKDRGKFISNLPQNDTMLRLSCCLEIPHPCIL